MIKLKDNTYTFVFAIIVCLVCSLTLSAVSQGLRAKTELNMDLDIKKNILKAVKLKTPLDNELTPKEVLAIYESKIEEILVDSNGNIVGDLGEDVNSMYVYKEEDTVVSYCFPIEGKGLWSTIYGYLALENDAVTVRGITFYKHGETPGLGGEIEKDWFLNNFKGKKIWSQITKTVKSISILKGKTSGSVAEEELPYVVDGISGATLTSRGVGEMLSKWIAWYDPYFQQIREAQQ